MYGFSFLVPLFSTTRFNCPETQESVGRRMPPPMKPLPARLPLKNGSSLDAVAKSQNEAVVESNDTVLPGTCAENHLEANTLDGVHHTDERASNLSTPGASKQNLAKESTTEIGSQVSGQSTINGVHTSQNYFDSSTLNVIHDSGETETLAQIAEERAEEPESNGHGEIGSRTDKALWPDTALSISSSTENGEGPGTPVPPALVDDMNVRARWVRGMWYAAQEAKRRREKVLKMLSLFKYGAGGVRRRKGRMEVLRQISESKLRGFLVGISTLWILFGMDVYFLTDPAVSLDTRMYAASFVCFTILAIDLILGATQRKHYVNSFYFWLDLVAILSVIPDVMWLFAPNSNSTWTQQVGFLTIARAARAARASTSASKVIRLVPKVKDFFRKMKRAARGAMTRREDSSDPRAHRARQGERLPHCETKCKRPRSPYTLCEECV